MKKPASKLLTIVFLASLLLTACRPVVPTPLDITLVPTRTVSPSEASAAAAAQAALAEKLGTPVASIEIQKIEPALWPDSCLGLGAADESCAQVVTSGYLVTLLAAGQSYAYRTDLAGKVARLVTNQGETPAHVTAAILALADSLTVEPATITLVSAESVEWPNACLGVESPDTACAEVITPGYRVLLSVSGVTYELHTNQDGSQVMKAGPVNNPSDQPVVILTSKDASGVCEQIVITNAGAGKAACDAKPDIKSFPGMQRPVELATWIARFASFEVSGVDGSLKFEGRGTEVAELEEQRALIAWTRLAFMDVSGLPTNPTAGLIIDWRRTGGLAGVCNRLMIYESGFAYARDCDQIALGQTLLPLEHLKLLYNWRDALVSTLITASDNVNDGYNYELQFNGVGNKSPDDTIKQAMLVLAAQLYTILVQ